MFSTLLDADGRPKVSCTNGQIVVIGLGNTYRADDGVGVVVAAALDELALPGVRVVTDVAEPMNLLEAWSGAGLAVVIDEEERVVGRVVHEPGVGELEAVGVVRLTGHEQRGQETRTLRLGVVAVGPHEQLPAR